MKRNENQSQPCRIYDKSLRQWFEVPKEYYEEFDKKRTAFRKREQYHGRCCCPREKWWLCDMFCEDCEYRRAGNLLSLDAPEGDGSVTLLDLQEAEGPRMEDDIADRMLLEQLIAKLRELDPESETIIQLWLDHPEGISDRKIAEALGRPQRTFADQMKKYRTELRKIYGH